jgi:hypothetical protein
MPANSNARNGQFIREGRSARSRLRPVRAGGTSPRKGRSGGSTWIPIVIALVLIGVVVWFLFFRDGGAAAALFPAPLLGTSKPRSETTYSSATKNQRKGGKSRNGN